MSSLAARDFRRRLKAIDQCEGFNTERCSACGHLILGSGIILYIQPVTNPRGSQSLLKRYLDIDCALNSTLHQVKQAALRIAPTTSQKVASEKKRKGQGLPNKHQAIIRPRSRNIVPVQNTGGLK